LNVVIARERSDRGNLADRWRPGAENQIATSACGLLAMTMSQFMAECVFVQRIAPSSWCNALCLLHPAILLCFATRDKIVIPAKAGIQGNNHLQLNS
jgi:hypothetical protein